MVLFHDSLIDEDELIEYTDAMDRPLLLGPRSEAAKLGLMYRVAGVILRDARARVCIRRQRVDNSGGRLWDLTATRHVRLGESREDAARRALEEETGIVEAALGLLAERVPDENLARMTLFSARSMKEFPDPARLGEHLFLDKDELKGLAEQMPELLTPRLLWAVRFDVLWKARINRRKAYLGSEVVHQA